MRRLFQRGLLGMRLGLHHPRPDGSHHRLGYRCNHLRYMLLAHIARMTSRQERFDQQGRLSTPCGSRPAQFREGTGDKCHLHLPCRSGTARRHIRLHLVGSLEHIVSNRSLVMHGQVGIRGTTLLGSSGQYRNHARRCGCIHSCTCRCIPRRSCRRRLRVSFL